MPHQTTVTFALIYDIGDQATFHPVAGSPYERYAGEDVIVTGWAIRQRRRGPRFVTYEVQVRGDEGGFVLSGIYPEELHSA